MLIILSKYTYLNQVLKYKAKGYFLIYIDIKHISLTKRSLKKKIKLFIKKVFCEFLAIIAAFNIIIFNTKTIYYINTIIYSNINTT